MINRSLALVPPDVPREEKNIVRVISCDKIFSSLRSIFRVTPNEVDH